MRPELSSLSSVVANLRSKGVVICLTDGRVILDNIEAATMKELATLKASRPILIDLLKAEDEADNNFKADNGETEDTATKPSNQSLDERIAEHNRLKAETRAELQRKRRDSSLVEISPGVFKPRPEIRYTYKIDLPQRGERIYSSANRYQEGRDINGQPVYPQGPDAWGLRKSGD
jgi:hypothetical protein